ATARTTPATGHGGLIRGAAGTPGRPGQPGRAGRTWATVTRPRAPFGGAPASRVALQGRAAPGRMRDAERSPPMPRRRARPAAPVLAVLALGMLAGCGAATSAKPAGAGTQGAAGSAVASVPLTGCGTTRTSAGVPVEIEIEHGPVLCRDALAVGRAYARGLASGKVRGNGGGAPVRIRGWVCKGFTTPEVLATGRASTCRKGAAQILAVLKLSATATPPP